MSGSWGYACADGPLEGVVLMLSAPTSIGSLWTVPGPQGQVCVYRYAGTHFEFVEEAHEDEA